MIKNILLCTDGSPSAEIAGTYALWLAKRWGGLVRALHITDVRLLEGPWLADLSGALGAQPYGALLPQLREIHAQKANVILSNVAARCRAENIACETIHATGTLVRTLLEQEAGADLVVLGQFGEHATWSENLLGSSVESMVRASVKPCLVTPPVFHEPQDLLLAYDGSTGSQLALDTAIDWALSLGTEMTILTVAPQESEAAATQSLHAAVAQAAARGLKAHPQLAHGHPEVEILAHAEKLGADLIVMGAYGHTRIREFILGSTTSHVLRQARVPVLLARG
jgi:nucleotide-binding universal stress UspA family protein